MISITPNDNLYTYTLDPDGKTGWRKIDFFIAQEDGSLHSKMFFLMRPDTVPEYTDTDLDGNEFVVPEQPDHLTMINAFDADTAVLEAFIDSLVENPDTAYQDFIDNN